MTNYTRCNECGGTFEKGWCDDEANAEAQQNFGNTGNDPGMAVFCDPCYRAIVGRIAAKMLYKTAETLTLPPGIRACFHGAMRAGNLMEAKCLIWPYVPVPSFFPWKCPIMALGLSLVILFWSPSATGFVAFFKLATSIFLHFSSG